MCCELYVRDGLACAFRTPLSLTRKKERGIPLVLAACTVLHPRAPWSMAFANILRQAVTTTTTTRFLGIYSDDWHTS
jgi:hypothetical protein